MLITQPRSKKSPNGPRKSLMRPGEAVLGKKPSTKNLVRLSLEIASLYSGLGGSTFIIHVKRARSDPGGV